jgi:hypothetical protein
MTLAQITVRGHQWTYDEVVSGTPHPIMMKAGGWKAGSRMVERYYGLHEVAKKGAKRDRNKQREREEGKR